MSAHPEDRCQRCQSANPVWFAPNEIWDRVYGRHSYNILCPNCFLSVAEAMGINRSAWIIQPESEITATKKAWGELKDKIQLLRSEITRLQAAIDIHESRCA